MLNAVSSLIQTNPLPATASPATAPAAKPVAAPEKSALGEDTYQGYVRLGGLAAGGGFAAYKLGNQVASHYKELAAALKPDANNLPAATPALQKVIGTSMKGAGLSALVAAGISAVSNGVLVAQGKSDAQTAVKNVVSDSITGAIGGFGAVSAAGAGSLILGSMGLVGLPLTIGTVIFGAAGGVLSGRLGMKLQESQRAVDAAMNPPAKA